MSQSHIINYFKAIGLSPGEFVLCEYCKADKAVDIHHIVPRSKFGSKMKYLQDQPNNLIAVCRKCHDRAHSERGVTEEMKIIARSR